MVENTPEEEWLAFEALALGKRKQCPCCGKLQVPKAWRLPNGKVRLYYTCCRHPTDVDFPGTTE